MTENPQKNFNPKDWLRTARTLTEALPYLQRYDNKTVVVKYGGHAMGSAKRSMEFATDVTLLKQCGINPVIVHGGGPQIAQMLDKLNISSEFVQGLRVTNAETMEVVQMVLAGSINKDIVGLINAQGGHAVGLCGKDAHLILAKQLQRSYKDPESNIEKIMDLGFVGDPEKVDTKVLDLFHGSDIIPVIAPVGADQSGHPYNINADSAAGAIAGALKADRLLLLTDVPGVKNKDGTFLPKISVSQARAFIKDRTVTGGMIPKLETCIDAVENGVDGVVIIDGRAPHALLLELFTEHGAGTLISRDD
ncbi:MAG: acetylglutamate kinase [Pseudomonadota bacterium]